MQIAAVEIKDGLVMFVAEWPYAGGERLPGAGGDQAGRGVITSSALSWLLGLRMIQKQSIYIIISYHAVRFEKTRTRFSWRGASLSALSRSSFASCHFISFRALMT